jgi:predicted ATPase
MLKRVKVSDYKSLVDVEVELKPLTVLIGPNAAGKSNFLDALQLLSRIVNARDLKEAFEPPYRGKPLESFTFPPGGLTGLLKRNNASFCIEVDVELSDATVREVENELADHKRISEKAAPRTGAAGKPAFIKARYLRYKIEIEIDPGVGFLRVRSEYLAQLNRHGDPAGDRKPFIEPVDGRIRLRMEGQAHPRDFETGLNHSIVSTPLYPPHYPHIHALRRELSNWFFFYFEPRERMRAPTAVKEVRHIGLMGEELAAFLNTLKATDPNQFRGIEKAVQAVIPSITGIDVSVNKIGEVELFLREDDVPIPARLLSEGTLRLLGLLTLRGTRERPSLIGFEEPENGIHPQRLELIAELLANIAAGGYTQMIVTSHSANFADLIDPASVFACKKEGLRTTIGPVSSWGPLGFKPSVQSALQTYESSRPLSERILRGDFDV